MTKQRPPSKAERQAAANAVAALGLSGTFTTDGLEGWEVHPEKIAEVLRTHSCCIPPAMSGWSETVTLPCSWGYWWGTRLTHKMYECDCGMAGTGSDLMGQSTQIASVR